MHIGWDVTIPLDDFIAMFSIDSIAKSPQTRKIVEDAKKEKRFVPCSGVEKAYIFTQHGDGKIRVYASPINASTLKKRLSEEDYISVLSEH